MAWRFVSPDQDNANGNYWEDPQTGKRLSFNPELLTSGDAYNAFISTPGDLDAQLAAVSRAGGVDPIEWAVNSGLVDPQRVYSSGMGVARQQSIDDNDGIGGLIGKTIGPLIKPAIGVGGAILGGMAAAPLFGAGAAGAGGIEAALSTAAVPGGGIGAATGAGAASGGLAGLGAGAVGSAGLAGAVEGAGGGLGEEAMLDWGAENMFGFEEAIPDFGAENMFGFEETIPDFGAENMFGFEGGDSGFFGNLGLDGAASGLGKLGGGLLGGLGGLFGGIKGMLPSGSTAAAMAPILAAIAYAKNQGPFDTSRLTSTYDQFDPAALAYEYDQNTARGRSDLTSSLSNRGVMGSSFANNDLTNFGTSRDLGRRSLINQGLVARGGLAGNILDAEVKERALKNDLYGKALLATGNVFGGRK